VSGIIIPMIVPVNCPLWILAIACAFAVVFAKEIFGGTGMNIFNVALITRAFLFFSYPSKMSGDAVWVAKDTIFGLGNTLPDAMSCATGHTSSSSTSSAMISTSKGATETGQIMPCSSWCCSPSAASSLPRLRHSYATLVVTHDVR